MRFWEKFDFSQSEHADGRKIFNYIARGRKSLRQRLHELAYAYISRDVYHGKWKPMMERRKQAISSAPSPFISTLANGEIGERAKTLRAMLAASELTGPKQLVISVREQYFPDDVDLKKKKPGKHYVFSFFPEKEDLLDHDFEQAEKKPRLVPEMRKPADLDLDRMADEVGNGESQAVEGTLGHVLLTVAGRQATIVENRAYKVSQETATTLSVKYPNWQNALEQAAKLFCQEKGLQLRKSAKKR